MRIKGADCLLTQIRNHKPGNTALVHHGKPEEQELENYLQKQFN